MEGKLLKMYRGGNFDPIESPRFVIFAYKLGIQFCNKRNSEADHLAMSFGRIAG